MHLPDWGIQRNIEQVRFFDSSEIKNKNHNLERKGTEFEPRKILIKMCCGFNRHKKRICGLQVIHTNRSWVSPYTSVLLR